jgi:THO complex subunit 5
MDVDSSPSDEVVAHFEELLLLAQDGPSAAADLQRLFSEGAVKILEYKQFHRDLCEQTEQQRVATSDAKVRLDHSSLQLQNLLYEQQHYEKEIRSCRAFRSKYSDEQVELLPEAEYLALPEVQADAALAGANPHQMMLNRLAHELASRCEARTTAPLPQAQKV